MQDWSPLGRLRTMQAELTARWGNTAHMTVTIQTFGNGLNLTMAEFDELLDHAEIGKTTAAAAAVLARRG